MLPMAAGSGKRRSGAEAIMLDGSQERPGASAPERRGGMARVLAAGIVKGGALGAGAAYLVPHWPLSAGLLAAALGMAVGVVAGRPFWSGDAWVATILKAVAGFPVGWGGHWLADKIGILDHPWIWLPAFAAVWAVLLETDDAIGTRQDGRAPPARQAP